MFRALIRAFKGLIRSGNSLFGPHFLPLVISFLLLGFSFVFFRMRGIEQDYAFNDLVKKYEKVSLTNKELKAQRAKLLSITNLRKIAKRNNLNPPTDKQIIVIP